MWIKFNFETVVGIGTTGGAHLLKKEVKFAIEVQKPDRALIVGNDLSNNDKVKDVKVMLNRPVDMYTIYINKDGCTESNSQHLVTNADIQSFIWAIKAGISMGKALAEK